MQKGFSMLKQLSLAVLVLGVAGCVARTQGVRVYAGAARPVSETAQLVAASEFEVRALDGVKGLGGMFSTASEVVYEVLPGPHVVSARFYSPFEGGTSAGASVLDRSDVQELAFDAAAGRRYALKRKTENGEVKLFIVESGAAVELGSATKPLAASKPARAPVAAEPAVAAAPAPAVKENAVEVPRITPLDNLKQWWFYASPAERAQFRAWAEAQK